MKTMTEKDELGSYPTDRRGFHLAVIYSLGTLIAMGLGVPAAVYLLLPPKSRREDQWVEVADLKQLEAGSPEEIVFRRHRVDGWKVSSEKTSAWVVKKSATDVVAFAPQCTHLGCAYRWDENRKSFLCPCHNSNFDINGNVLNGPAPRPLDRYQIKLEGSKLFLGTVQKSEA